MRQKQSSKKRHYYNTMGLVLSSAYLLLTFLLKWTAFSKFEAALKTQHIEYLQIDTRPSPLNTILWSANVETKDAYLLGNYSFFDSKPIAFEVYPKNHDLLGDLVNQNNVKRMIEISEGWFTIIKKNEQLYFNDLRFGLLSLEPKSENFVFQYEIEIDDLGKVTFLESTKDARDGKKLLSDLWTRMKGN